MPMPVRSKSSHSKKKGTVAEQPILDGTNEKTGLYVCTRTKKEKETEIEIDIDLDTRYRYRYKI